MDSPAAARRQRDCFSSCEGSSAKRKIRRTGTPDGHFVQHPLGMHLRSTRHLRRIRSVVCLLLLVTMVQSLQPNIHNLFSSRRVGREASSTQRRMVLRTPESIIEQASTTTLLDHLIDESVRTSARRPIMMQFDPSSGWIWKRWKGTIFSETWDDCVTKMVYASIVFIICRSVPQIKPALSGFNILWAQLLSVTTFTLTFFVNQSYALWKKCSELSRSLQGRLHDLDLALATHAARMPSKRDEPSTYTAPAKQILQLVSRYVRLFNLLTYASFTRSHRPILTPAGMRRLVDRGLMTSLEREVLIAAEVPATQRHNAVLMWIIRAFIEGKEAGHFIGHAGFEQQFMEKAHVCRSAFGGIGDELNGRMPLAYVHIVQVLVDLVLWMYPLMAYSSGMSGLLCVIGTGLLTLGYQGLFDLAKQFLDPYDNENYGKGEDPLVVDTLIAETNAGSVRWMNSLEMMPVSNQRIRDGDLEDFLLPVRGYSVDELAVMEKERKEKQEQKERKEKKKRLSEERKKRINQAAQQLIPYHRTPEQVEFSAPKLITMRVGTKAGKKLDSSQPVDTSLKVIENVVDLINDHGLMQSLQTELIPVGTALASSYVEALPQPKIELDSEPASLENLGALDRDDIIVLNEEIEFAKQREREKLKALEDLQQSLREIGSTKQGQSVVQATIGQVDKVVDYQNGYPSSDAETPKSTDAATTVVKGEFSNAKGSYMASDLPVLGDEKLTAATIRNDKPVQSMPGSLEVPPLSRDSSRAIEEDDESTTDETPEDGEVTSETFTFEEYERKVQKLLDIEKEELLETAAILNARPGADLELPAKERHNDAIASVTEAGNASSPDNQINADSSDADFDDDTSDETLMEEGSQPVGSQLQEKSVDELSNTKAMMIELLETEAILNARPGAEGFEEKLKDRSSDLIVNATRADDLSILEMDEPSTFIADVNPENFPIPVNVPTIDQNEAQSISMEGSAAKP